jgi:hypothetical protein
MNEPQSREQFVSLINSTDHFNMAILKIRVHLPWSEIVFIVGSLEMEKTNILMF